MTKVKSIRVPFIPAMLISCGLILVDISYNLIGLLPYYTRTYKNIKKYSPKMKSFIGILCY